MSYKGRGKGEKEEEKGEEQLHDDWEIQCNRARGEYVHAATGSSKRVLAGVCVCVFVWVCVQMSEGEMW